MSKSNIDIIITVAAGTILAGLFLAFIFIFIVVYRKKQQEYEWDKEQVKQLLLKTEIEIKEQTLSNISRELHDNLGQVASLIKINLGLLKTSAKNTNVDIVVESFELTKQLISDIKLLSTTLKSENLSRFGLYKMIKKDIERLNKISVIEFKLKGLNTLPSISNEIEVFLYRMSQEIFNNVLQHAHAKQAELNISKSQNELLFIFSDNGKGFDSKSNKMGSGLINLHERCEIIKADLKINSQIGVGTKIKISINLKK